MERMVDRKEEASKRRKEGRGKETERVESERMGGGERPEFLMQILNVRRREWKEAKERR